MNQGTRILVALLFLAPIRMLAQQTSYSPAEIDRMIMAYTFYQKQKISLEVIANKYPTLKELSVNASKTWDLEFLPAIIAIDSALTDVRKGEWKKAKEAIINRYTRDDYSRVQEAGARQYIQTVNVRGYGQIETPVIETLLTWKPVYRKFPEREMTEGMAKNFFVRDASKTFPVNIKMIYPKSWNSKTILRKPKFQQVFTSNCGLGNVSMTLLVEPAKSDFSKERIQLLLSKKEMQKTMAPGDIVLAYKPDQIIDNCPSASIVIYHQGAAKPQVQINELYSLYYKNYHIRVSFTFTSTYGQEQVMASYENNRTLVKKIISQLVILSQWGQ